MHKRSLLPAIRHDYIKFDYFLLKAIKLASRNRAFLKNIINIFENSKLQKKSFHVIVGAAHAPYLYEELRSRNYNVKLNEWAQEEYDIWYMEALIIGKKLIDKTAVNEIVTLVTKKRYKKLRYHDPLIVQDYGLQILGKLAQNNLIDQKVVDDYELGNLAIEKLDNYPANALFLLGKLIENKLINAKFIEIHELEKLAREKLIHEDFVVRVNALWLLSFLLESEILLNLELVVDCLEKLHHSLIILEEKLSKENLEFLISFFDKLLVHAEQKTKDLLIAINSNLKNRLDAEENLIIKSKAIYFYF